jgi:hypothetical protein
MDHPQARATYRRRQAIVEPCFAELRERQGIEAVSSARAQSGSRGIRTPLHGSQSQAGSGPSVIADNLCIRLG